MTDVGVDAAKDLAGFARGRKFSTILADPPWRFTNRTGKMAPEHRLSLRDHGPTPLDASEQRPRR